jgi:hypothetical protein
MISPENPPTLSKSAFLALRDEWIDAVNQASGLSHAATRVGTFIALRMNAEEQCSYWPVDKIAKMLPSGERKRMSTSTVSKAIADLVKENFLVVVRPNRRANQRYFLHLPRNAKIASLSNAKIAS